MGKVLVVPEPGGMGAAGAPGGKQANKQQHPRAFIP